jgi:nitrile hydratase subunit beta
MNSIHDMGGMHGLGPVAIEQAEKPFHEEWEGRVAGLLEVMTFPPGFTVDRFRYLRETLRPDLYLTQSYYEQWLYIAEQALLEAGMVTLEELRSGRSVDSKDLSAAPIPPGAVWDFLHDRTHSGRSLDVQPRFAVGQKVRARNIHPNGHTRLPRYARGKTGAVVRLHGGHVLPDASAHGRGEQPQHLYTVGFSARELWGAEAPAKDRIFLDLWESYLELA